MLDPMKAIREAAVGVAGVALMLAFSEPARCEIQDNPYQVIIERNVFDVHAPPPPDPNAGQPVTPAPPPATFRLTGITTLGGVAKALAEITPGPGKTPVKPIMVVGERIEGVELLAIDVKEATVKIRNGTTEMTVGFSNAPVAAAAVNPAAVALRSGLPVPIPMPAAVTPGATPGYNPNAPTYGNRGAVTVAGANSVAPTAAIPAPVTTGVPTATPIRTANPFGTMPTVNPAVPTYRAIPQRPVRTENTPTSSSPPMSRAEAEIHMELLRTIQQQKAAQGLPPGPPLPPTTLTPQP